AAAPSLRGVDREPAAGDDLRVVPVGARLPGLGAAAHRALRAAAGLAVRPHRLAAVRADRAPAVRRGRLPRDRARPSSGCDPDLPRLTGRGTDGEDPAARPSHEDRTTGSGTATAGTTPPRCSCPAGPAAAS